MKNRTVQFFVGNGFPLIHMRVLPNDPCRCGSGKKTKKCCRTETPFYYSKLTEKQKSEKEVPKTLELEQKITIPTA